MTVTIDDLVKIAVIIMGIWGFVKVIMEIIKAITARHDREKEWDKASQERADIVTRYDDKLIELENKIDENHCDTEAKIQELKAELYTQTECMLAVLDGLSQLNCNGPVTEAKNHLMTILNERAHD